MKLSTSLSAIAGLTASTAASNTPIDEPPSSHLFQNPDPSFFSSSQQQQQQRIPTSYESAVLGRRILALTPLATLSTVFPTSYATAAEDADGLPQSILMEQRPAGLGGVPIGLMDYIADCDPAPLLSLSSSSSEEEGGEKTSLGNGDPTILAIQIATSFKNVDAGSNMSVSVNWVPPFPPKKRIESEGKKKKKKEKESSRGLLGWAKSWLFEKKEESSNNSNKKNHHGSHHDDDDHGHDDHHHHHHHHYDPVPYSAANLPRFSLLGYLEPILPLPTNTTAAAEALRSCFLSAHPDAKYWLPGNRIHESEWVRLVVTQVYWIGGFGDRAYIGWIPVEEWRNVTRQEWEGVRLPGEKEGWEEWSVEGAGEEEMKKKEGEWEL
ncbi:hypothetical protein M406DRAFT_354985 [Cryphonectria parasitica EP155]|uniref:CREG-like beta-barrel domain-containing protein n=1 Tax=Cryphonectria parasitica (strain ATCC 38755 / EP155) TaxID=660469 RepID=A0A9P5CSL0_CRYP1|nr:uncharacterized protein M406DRAFT_354985 [Cryphonectria parasitica EP155]KAF3768722.1 hypothetical protein M406DRAFT_354985 [Cryphonectria parasitica EP155]